MKQVITFIIALLCAICALAQTEAQDSIKAKELGEVVVEAQMQRINAEVSTYIPMARQKNAAQNAVSLLSMMSIPQISVDPVSQAVQTAHGQNVSIFIDYLPATASWSISSRFLKSVARSSFMRSMTAFLKPGASLLAKSNTRSKPTPSAECIISVKSQYSS